MSYIVRDKISLPELVAHLRDHCVVTEGRLLHWLFPGKELDNGLRALVDDKVCMYMSECITDGGVAEIFVEKEPNEMEIAFAQESSDDVQEVHKKVVRRSESREQIERQIKHLHDFNRSPSKKGKEVVQETGPAQPDEASNKEEGSDSYEDSDYMPGDDCSSEDDEETHEILKRFKTFKMKLRSGAVPTLADVELGDHAQNVPQVDSEGYGTPYPESNDEDSVEEIGSDGEIRQKKEFYPRFKCSDEVPHFQLGMKFSGKKEFKDDVIKYALHERKVIKFVKDDPIRVRAVCEWKHCPWVCLCSKNSRTTSWQVATFIDGHICPPRRDNKLVTSRRIAEKYEKFIMAS
ncbi:hypothetical protein HU200_052649 [Digitaria exilis]|uniref:Transposase MuDR plant domain-containing protein n=1 Tax=Digitaria exilis TaxID=1010633 RepID=A0A835ANQ3_9POAL|nr:hypothetical protein HU200_052649 [Digitaria exilis]